MPRYAQRRRASNAKHRIMLTLALASGLVSIYVYLLVHIVDSQHDERTRIRSSTRIIDVDATDTKTPPLVREKPDTTSASQGKERLLRMLAEAGVHNISEESLKQLPTWEQVVELYGDSPKIVGLETCDEFRETIDPTEALVGPAGTFNTGTNLLAELLWSNCVLTKRFKKYNHYGFKWQVNWGKHEPPRFRSKQRFDKSINNTNIMPVVAVRDPYGWMQSMCRNRYSADWFLAPGHCPNLVPNHVDRKHLEYAPVKDTFNFTWDSKVVPVYVKYNLVTTSHESLAHMWNDWYYEYLQTDFPRLFVRMEDLVFHTHNVTDTICKCAGGDPLRTGFQYITESAKGDEIRDGQFKTTLLDAMIRYGRLNRTKGMTREDAAYAQGALRQDLMEIFGYSHPNES